jgi:hypothetical protein
MHMLENIGEWFFDTFRNLSDLSVYGVVRGEGKNIAGVSISLFHPLLQATEGLDGIVVITTSLKSVL